MNTPLVDKINSLKTLSLKTSLILLSVIYFFLQIFIYFLLNTYSMFNPLTYYLSSLWNKDQWQEGLCKTVPGTGLGVCIMWQSHLSLFFCPSCIDPVICEWEGVSASYIRTLLVGAFPVGTDE